MDIFEQFHVTVYRTLRARGGYICDTDQGVRLVREYNGREEGLKKQAFVTDSLESMGIRTDAFVRKEDGGFLAQDEDYRIYYMKKWFDGRECDVSNKSEILEAVRMLAELHKALAGVEISAENVNETKELAEVLKKRIKEMTGARNYLKAKKRRNVFEKALFETIDDYLKNATNVQNTFLEKCVTLPERRLCHGSFNHHNIIMCRTDCVATNFSRASLGYQVSDLYDFMRKMLEKHDWDVQLGMSMYDEYCRKRELSQAEAHLLAVLFLFPEKYWKIVNHYYNSNKAWFPDKDMEKLIKLKKQEVVRNFFTEKFAYNVGLW